MTQEPWYKEGLRFKCTGCGKCCTGGAGYVWVTHEEIAQLAAELDLSTEEFSRLYVRKIGQRYSLKEVKTERGYDCVFLKGKECSLYGARPIQCRTFPFWPSNLKSRKTWEDLKEECEGVEHPEAPLLPVPSPIGP